MKANIRNNKCVRIKKSIEKILKNLEIVGNTKNILTFESHEYIKYNESNSLKTNLWGKQGGASPPVLTRFHFVCSCSDLPFTNTLFRMHEQKNDFNNGKNSTNIETLSTRNVLTFISSEQYKLLDEINDFGYLFIEALKFIYEVALFESHDIQKDKKTLEKFFFALKIIERIEETLQAENLLFNLKKMNNENI